MKYKVLLILTFFNCFLSFAKELYVAPTGNDTNDGSITNPVETIKRAQALAISGDIVYIRGGVYTMREDQIAEYNSSIWAFVTKLDKSGISYLAYPNETPIFDYQNVKPANYRVTAFYINGSNIRIKGIEVIGVQVTITTHTQSECFEIQGSNNTLEQIKMHDNMAIGVYMIKGSNNLILNCDAYRNYDSVSEGGTGGNTDGFGFHLKKGSINNVIRGCRSWYNSDDGFDLINNAEAVLIENCWSFYNGYSISGSNNFVSRGDGNGFKAGGYGAGGTPYATILSSYTPIPKNIIRFCLAVKNKQSGFYANHHLDGNYWYNNTAYLNKRNYNMLNCVALNATDYATDGPGWNHTLANNLGFAATTAELTDIDKPRCVLTTNYFDLTAITVTSNDFLSTDETLLTAPRQADGSLPNNNFLKLKSTSKLIDAGTDIGFTFKGIAPDLGCFESNSTTLGLHSTTTRTVAVYPNPTSDILYLQGINAGKIRVYNNNGRLLIEKEVDETKSINLKGLAAGLYMIKISGEKEEETFKIILK
ncbi:right-handed parallel beta-helix repeat-containing protein [Flavobacterium sp. WC2509]|uniref:right-handed parallel beta-helix repeat-containing protein n=1 Tax=Flavobacterium sp. WC2509 TaxID=3461406 RepID=UPI004044B049